MHQMMLLAHVSMYVCDVMSLLTHILAYLTPLDCRHP